MMNRHGFNSNHLRTAGSLMSFLLVCIFAVVSVLIVTFGIQAYEQVIENTEANTQLRTSFSYTANKIHAHDGLGGIESKQIDGIPVLALYQTIDGDDYVTYIYCHNGMLYECFAPADAEFDPEQGEKLSPLKSFRAIVEDDGVLQIFTDLDGTEHTQYTAVMTE